MHGDYAEEYLQSGEKIRGKDNVPRGYENYPGLPTPIDYSGMLSGDLAVVEVTLEYEGNRMNVCDDSRLRGRQDQEGEGVFCRAV